jgi:hypothetical protein
LPTDLPSLVTLIVIAIAALIDVYLMRHLITFYLKAQKHAAIGDPWRRERMHRNTSWRYAKGIMITTVIGLLPYVLLKGSTSTVALP